MTILNLQQQLLKSTVEEAINELRSSLESCPSYWQRKSSILTAQAAGVIPLRLLKVRIYFFLYFVFRLLNLNLPSVTK